MADDDAIEPDEELEGEQETEDVDAETPRRRLALDLQDLLLAPPGRIGACADAECAWMFLDTSRSRNRLWCSSAACGNRYRVRQHQLRRRAAQSS